jgi:hypothetical protein
MNHDYFPVCIYLGPADIAFANKMTGQMAMNRITPKATSSDK